jgi:hypothetical protein
MERARILQQLEEDLAKAREWRNRASARFDEAISHAPSAIPYPDSTERVKVASKEYTLALQAVQDALKKQSDFLLRGILPPGLKERSACGASLQEA